MSAIFDLMGEGAMFIDFGGSSSPEPEPDPPGLRTFSLTAGELAGAGTGYADVNGFSFGSISREPVSGSTLQGMVDDGTGQMQCFMTENALGYIFNREPVMNGVRYTMFSQWVSNGDGQIYALFNVELANALVPGTIYAVEFLPRAPL